MNETTSTLLINIGAPFLIGMAVGYFIKKTLKVSLFFLGLALVMLMVSNHFNIIEINSPALVEAVEGGSTRANQFGSFLVDSLKNLGGVGISGGVAGFFAGLKFG